MNPGPTDDGYGTYRYRALGLTPRQLLWLSADPTFSATRLPAAFRAAARIRCAHQLALALKEIA